MTATGTKEKLLAIAAERFLAVGPDGVSLRDVAKRAGITPMAVYRHYADKEALLLAVVEQGFANYAAYLRPVSAVPDPADHLRWLAGRVFDFATEQGAYFELMFLTARTIRGAGRSQHNQTYSPADLPRCPRGAARRRTRFGSRQRDAARGHDRNARLLHRLLRLRHFRGVSGRS